MKLFVRLLTSAFLIGAFSASAFASQQVYHFTDPTFGGNPLGGTFLLGVAQGQGFGAQSGQGQPNLSGLDSALSNLGTSLGSSLGSAGSGSVIVIPSSP
jgi:curli production assembly/transport component CsgF